MKELIIVIVTCKPLKLCYEIARIIPQEAWDEHDPLINLAFVGISTLQPEDLNPNALYIVTASGKRIMAIGSDHFVREDPEIDDKTAALLPTLFKFMAARLKEQQGARS